MHFIHDHRDPNETIAAIATPMGEGGVAIVRISGKGAVECANAVFSGDVTKYNSHTVHWGKVLDWSGKEIDDALVIPMLGGRSFTGEDTVEIQCHGGSLIARKVLETVLRAGARAAKPGEFSMRAFLNGKIDLAQAEAIQEVIAAKNELALSAAREQLNGSLSTVVGGMQERLVEIAAILEAWVDFPEEGLEFAPKAEVVTKIEEEMGKVEKLISTFHDGRIAKEGVHLCLIGAPNVGKSSLMNALLERERAIVSPIAGTTRDILEEQLRIGGMHFRLTDTAGIRETRDLIEMEGVNRSKKAMEEADLILFLLDLGREMTEEEKELLSKLPKEKTLVVWNKVDKYERKSTQECAISAQTREGIDHLLSLIDGKVWKMGPPSFEEVMITSVRHKEALEEALESFQKVKTGLEEGFSPEFISFDMRNGLKELGKIIGFDITEDILSSVFSQFCVGK